MNSTEVTETSEALAETIAASETEAAPHQEHEHTHEHNHSHGPSLNPELTREIEVEVPADEVSKTYRTVVKRYQRLAHIPGFRAGKVPESLIRSKFAKEVRQEVMESLVSERFRKAIDDRKLKPVSEPQLLDLQLFDGQPLKFKAAFEVLPEFEVAGYESVRVERPDTSLTDDDLESELMRMMEHHVTVETIEEDRPLADGDWAEIQFRGEIKPLAQIVTEEGAPATEPIVGDDILIEVGGKNTVAAFNDALRGARAGQELTFEVDYPADFGERRLAGQTVAYDLTVKAIKRKTYPDRDDDLAKQLGNYSSWEDLDNQVRMSIQSRKRESLEMGARNKMLDEIIDRYHFPVPESFVQQQIDARLERGLRALAEQGMKPEDMRKLDFPRLRQAQRAEAEREVRASLVLDRIADVEDVKVSDAEMDNELLILSMQSREPLETLRERLKQDGGLNRLREQLRRERTGLVLYGKLSSQS